VDVPDVFDEEDVWTWEEVVASHKEGLVVGPAEEIESSGNLNGSDCPEGEEMRYGKCVPREVLDGLGDAGGDKAGNCSLGLVPSPTSIWLLLGLLSLLGWRRRQ
jgi:hypothetical protein